MVEKNSSKKTKTKGQPVLKIGKAQLLHKMKIEMIKYCLVWCYDVKQSIEYFKSRGVPLSPTHYYEMKREFNSDESTRGWYSEQAIYAMENSHKNSIEQLNALIETTMIEIQQLKSTPVYINDGNDEFVQMKLNEQHDSIALAKMMDTFNNLLKTRDDSLAATPVVQAIMNKHAMNMEKEREKLISV